MLFFSTIFSDFFLKITAGVWLILWLCLKYLSTGDFQKQPLKIASFCVAITLFLLWFSLLFSRTELPFENPLKEPVADGGFPLTCFYYPLHPMGSDYPPIEQWQAFFLNYLFWFLVALVGVFRFREKVFALVSNRVVFTLVIALSFLVNEFGLLGVFFGFE